MKVFKRLAIAVTLVLISLSSANAQDDIYNNDWSNYTSVKSDITVPTSKGSCRGEDWSCGQSNETVNGVTWINCVSCGNINFFVPKDKELLRVRVLAKEASQGWDSAVLAQNCKDSRGWCSLERYSTDSNSDGSRIIRATLKNWKHDRTRNMRLEVWWR